MKKHFLLIPLFAWLFLWLGNYSHAAGSSVRCLWTSSAKSAEIRDSHYFSCETNAPTNTVCTDTGNAQSCYTPIAGDTCTTPMACCICKKPEDKKPEDKKPDAVVADTTGQPCTIAGSALNWDRNAIISMPGIACTCKPQYGEATTKTNKITCQPCSDPDVCCGVKLNTSIPFIGNCIESSSQASGALITETTAFPILIGSLIKIVISVILIVSFILIIVAGVMMATGDSKWGKDMIIKVAIGLAILWASGVILRLINPNFFG